tara:strand:- start:197 stop:694 length:498 start_codon:yes stop_codon:yes gene_type:complete
MNNSLTSIYWDTKSPIYKISLSELSKMDIRCLLLDVDGTLISRNTEILPHKVKNWIQHSKELFDLYLISNNPSKKRIERIGHELGVNYKYKALKPRKKNILEVIKKMNIDKNNIAIIGDRIFTDIIVGNRCNIKTILVQSLNKKGLPKKFNATLMLEKLFSKFLP